MNNKLLYDQCGSMAYSPPEIIIQKPYFGLYVDIWSLGIVLYALVLGGFPFYDINIINMKNKIINGKLKFPKSLNNNIRDLILIMLCRVPEKRAQIYDVLDHIWLLDDDSDDDDDNNNIDIIDDNCGCFKMDLD